MLDTWEGGWDSGSSCVGHLGEAGVVDVHVGHLGGEAGVVGLHVGYLGGRLRVAGMAAGILACASLLVRNETGSFSL